MPWSIGWMCAVRFGSKCSTQIFVRPLGVCVRRSCLVTGGYASPWPSVYDPSPKSIPDTVLQSSMLLHLSNSNTPVVYQSSSGKHTAFEPCQWSLVEISPSHLICICVTDPSVTLAHKVGPGLQDLQKRGQRILAERNTEKAEENMWIGRMVAAESIGELDGLIRSRAA